MCKPYTGRYVPPQRVWVLGHFGLKMDTEFAHFALETSMVFKGTTEVHKKESGEV